MLSFIVIGKNEGWRLEKCFNSIVNVIEKDNVEKYEIIYIDSKSTDGSIEIAKKYKKIKIFLIQGVCNSAIARNIGAKESKGDILFFIDGDMEVQEGFFQSIINEKNELIYPFTSGLWNDIVYDKEWNFLYTIRRDKDGINDKYEQTTGGLFIISLELWNLLGGMDERLVRHQDLDIGYRAYKHGFPIFRKGVLLANHNTIQYEDRADSLGYYKYTGLLFRKHFLSRLSFRILLCNQYTSFCLVISMILALLINPIFISLYIMTVLYRTIKICISQKKNINGYLSIFSFCVKRDFIFIFSVFFFFPKKKQSNYISVI